MVCQPIKAFIYLFSTWLLFFLTDDFSEPHDSPVITEPKKITTIGMLNSEATIITSVCVYDTMRLLLFHIHATTFCLYSSSTLLSPSTYQCSYILIFYFVTFFLIIDDISEPHDSPVIIEPKKITTIGMLNSEATIITCVCVYDTMRLLLFHIHATTLCLYSSSTLLSPSTYQCSYILIFYFVTFFLIIDDISEPHDSPVITEPKKVTTTGMLNSEATINTFIN